MNPRKILTGASVAVALAILLAVLTLLFWCGWRLTFQVLQQITEPPPTSVHIRS